MDYTLGLDIGITSVGSCAIDQKNARLIELSVRKFDEAKEAKEARLNRSARRTLRRKKWRKDQLLDAFNDFGVISKEEIAKEGRNNYLNFYGKGEGLVTPNVFTVYHLRQKALNEEVSKRELLLCLYNILQARGHFLMDTIDFSREGVSFELFKNKFYELAEQYVNFVSNRTDFEEKVLKAIFTGEHGGLKALQKLINDNRFAAEEDDDDRLNRLCYIIAGGKAVIGDFYNNTEEKSLNIETLKKKDDLNEFQNALIELSDICRISRILKDGNEFVCDVAVKEIDRFAALKKNKIEDKKEYEEWAKASKKKIRAYKNLNNSYPNGLYVKEANSILHNQQKYHNEISDAFIEVCCSIISARIPYYIGPLGENAKNRWAVKKDKIKYSFDYSADSVDVIESIKNWKKNMVSHCTYLPEEIALPKGSLLGEVFSIINEINNYNCVDKDENDYYLTREDKFRIIDELFMKQNSVSLKDVEKLLDLKSYDSVRGKTLKFNNSMTVYKQIADLVEELRIDSVEEIFKDKEKIDQIEELILDINLFDEGKLKMDYFAQKYPEDIAKKLSNIKSNGFYSFSKKFIYETAMNPDGESMLDILFDDNSSSHRNNQQVIISNACDKDGNKIDFLSNKYERILKNNNNELSIDLIIDNGKPLMPISRPVIRALNEAFKVYNGYLDIYGVPSRVVVETAKGKDSIKDFTEQNGSPMKHYAKTAKLVEYLFSQIDEKDRNNQILEGKIESWEELESYYNANKEKIELYIRQDGIDLLTGKKIDISHLEEYEVDHILPRGFGDDSQDDKILVSKTANGMKGDRLPIEFLESTDAAGFKDINVSKYVKIVNKLAEMKMISDKKQERLLLKDQTDAEGFINQNLVDTRYVISQFVAILNAFNRVNGYDTHVVCMNSSFTKLYSRVLDFKKDRDLGDQHHAYDAACLCIADKCINEYFPNYDQRSNAYGRGSYAGFNEYNQFVNELRESGENEESKDKLRRFVVYAFKKAYGQDVYKLGKEAPLIEEIKSRVPLLSWKVEKNFDGKLFDATMYEPKGEHDNSVLTLLGVNNDKRSFDSVYPVATDFYKINHKHYAIQIPLAIINKDGSIDRDKYIRIIRDHYKANELLDDEGNIKTNAFRFRAFKNDMVYDTCTNECHLFNLGSIAVKKNEMMPLNIFSYKEIYDMAGDIRSNIIKDYKLKTKKNPKGGDFSDLDKSILTKYVCNELGLLNNPDKHMDRLYELTKDITNLYQYSEKLSYYANLTRDVYLPPMFDNRILPVANNDLIKKDEDAQYVKIKYNILGVRFSNNDKGTLIVEGPRGYKNGGFKLIKKEEFHWTISRDMVK